MDREIKANWDCKEASIVDSKKKAGNCREP